MAEKAKFLTDVVKNQIRRNTLGRNIFFMHIPKCGGMSLLYSIASTLPVRQLHLFKRYGLIDAKATSELANELQSSRYIIRQVLVDNAMKKNSQLIFGHIPFHPRILKRNYQAITLVRDPVKRFISEYLYIHRNRFDFHSYNFEKIKLDFSGFINSERSAEAKITYRNYFSGSHGNPLNIEQIINNINSFTIIRDLDDLNGFKTSCKNHFGINMPTYYRNKVRNSSISSDLYSEFCDELEVILTDELKIYRHCLRIKCGL